MNTENRKHSPCVGLTGVLETGVDEDAHSLAMFCAGFLLDIPSEKFTFEAAFSANCANASAVPGFAAACFVGRGIAEALVCDTFFSLNDVFFSVNDAVVFTEDVVVTALFAAELATGTGGAEP